MFCKNCGNQIPDGSTTCAACGSSVASAPQAAPAAAPTYTIPAEYKPLGAWAYFSLNILFSIPIVGFTKTS